MLKMIQATIGGPETINLSEKVLTDVEFAVITPEDANARSTDQYTQLTLTGRIIPSVASAEGEPTVALDRWAAVTDDKADAYRPVNAKVVESGVVLREYKLPHAFVVDYQVAYTDEEGNGLFTLLVRQKKDKTKEIAVEGGYAG
jgi:hypothetical protein